MAVTDVDPTSEAAEKGLKAGDVILEVGGKSVTSPAEVTEGVRDAKGKGRKAVLMQIRSERQTRFVALSLNGQRQVSAIWIARAARLSVEGRAFLSITT